MTSSIDIYLGALLLAKDVASQLKTQKVDVAILEELSDAKQFSGTPSNTKLIQAAILPLNGNLTWQFQMSFEGWGLIPQTKGKSISDFGSNLTQEVVNDYGRAQETEIIVELVVFLIKAPLALAVHSQEGDELVQQLYQKRADGTYELLCSRYPFSLSHPISYEGNKTVRDLNCDEIEIYRANPSSSPIALSKLATDHFKMVDTPTTVHTLTIVNNLDDLKPLQGKIEFR